MKQYRLYIDGTFVADETVFKKIFKIAKEKLLSGEGQEANIKGPGCDCFITRAPKTGD